MEKKLVLTLKQLNLTAVIKRVLVPLLPFGLEKMAIAFTN